MIRTVVVAAAIASAMIGAAQTANASPSTNSTVQSSQSDVYYKNCAAARDAGVAPIHEGEDGYRSGLDRDGDGVACE